MKLVGFIKELDNYDWASPLCNELGEESNAEELVNNIISYLEKGKLILGWMGYFVDLRTQDPIAPHAFLTDGVWVWPSYYLYYLKMYPQYRLDNSFINYLREKNFVIGEILNEDAILDEFIEQLKN